jgi:hypothetical protein
VPLTNWSKKAVYLNNQAYFLRTAVLNKRAALCQWDGTTFRVYIRIKVYNGLSIIKKLKDVRLMKAYDLKSNWTGHLLWPISKADAMPYYVVQSKKQ